MDSKGGKQKPLEVEVKPAEGWVGSQVQKRSEEEGTLCRMLLSSQEGVC